MDSFSKCKEIVAFPQQYVVLDLETTGLSIENDYIIEIAAIKIKDQQIIDSFQTLLHCPCSIDARIEALCSISNKMLYDAPIFSEIAGTLYNFIKDEIVVGHHVCFDLGFLSRYFVEHDYPMLENQYIDTVPLSQKLHPEMVHHRLKDVAAYYNISTENAHRALFDCQMNYQVFEKMKQTVLRCFDSYDAFIEKYPFITRRLKADMVTVSETSFDITHPLYQKNCVITGVISYMSRREAYQKIKKIGGIVQDKLTTSTDFLILGKEDTSELLSGFSAKHQKALRLIEKGYSIQILTPEEFFHYFDIQNT